MPDDNLNQLKLNSTHVSLKKNWGIETRLGVVHAFNPNTGKVEAGASL